MDTATQYNVVFNGAIREGFERRQVALTLAQKLHLDGNKVRLLFDGADHTLKRTTTREDAQKVVEKLAQMGAVARIEAPAAAAAQPAPTAAPPPQAVDEALAPFSPLTSEALFKPLLYLAVGAEVIFSALYLFVLLTLGYFTFFTLWASSISEYPLLLLVVQLLSVPLLTVVLLLLAKPLLSLRSRPYHGILVHEEQEPDLYMFVEDVCERLGVPAPTEIRLNNDVALIVHHRGLVGFWRNEYVLTLGVPLLASLKTNQLAALLTREMLCFHPRPAPRAGFLLMATNRWLHVALHREDAFDLGLKNWLEHGRLSASTVEKLQQLFAFTRRLMRPRQVISQILGRRLVHHIVAMADDEAFAMAGREGLSQAMEQQRLIAHAAEDLIPKLQKQWDEKGVLPDDMVQLTLLRARQFPVTIHAQLRQQQEQNKAAVHDIIPADTQRINRLGAELSQPGYACVSPALTLVRYFSKLATTMTVRYYHNRLNLPITPNKLIHPLVKGSAEDQLQSALNSYFNGVLHLMQPLNLQTLTDNLKDKDAARKQWREAMQRIKADHAQAKHDFAHNTTAEKQLADNSMREALYRAELWHKMGERKMNKGDFEAFLQQCRDMEGEYEQTLKKVTLHQQFYAQRLAAALVMLQPPEEEEDSDHRYMEIVMLLTVYSRIEAVLPSLRELKLFTSMLHILLSYLNGDRASSLKDRVDEEAADIRQLVASIKLALKDVPNPFPAQRGGKELMKYLLLEAFKEETPEGDFDRGNDIVNRLALVQKKILARLIEIAAEAEQSLS
jgi:hypothetical protein